MPRIVTMMAALVLAACEEQAWQWVKPGATQQDFQLAAYECERDTRMASRSFGYGVVAENEARQFIIRCMNARGFYQQGIVNTPPPKPGPAEVEYLARYDAWLARWKACKSGRSYQEADICAGPRPTREGQD